MIEVDRLCKRYGSLRAVDDVSFDVEDGTVVGFLGPNGAGKSTTLRILAGFLGATTGSVRIGGHDIVDERIEAVQLIGYMPETTPLYREMRVAEYLRFRAELKGIKRADRRTEVGRVLEAARVDDMAKVLIDHLSKGYRQRVGLADALLGSPPLLILDEPTAGLDPNQIRAVRALIRQLASDHTILLSTHILSEVEATCDRAIVIHEGKLVASGTIEELRKEQTPAALELVVSRARAEGKDRKMPAGPLAVVRAVDGVHSAKSVQVDQGVARIELQLDTSQDAGEVAERLVLALVQAKLGVQQLTPMAASLEEVFSQLTGQPEDEPDGADDDEMPSSGDDEERS